MAVSSGKPEVVIGVIDGPVDLDHPVFGDTRIRVTCGTSARGVSKSEQLGLRTRYVCDGPSERKPQLSGTRYLSRLQSSVESRLP